MKSICCLLAASLYAMGASNPGLAEVKNVYLLPMASGLDQFLAIRLTSGGTVQIVTDPHKADAILTDRIGASFEQTLDELYKVKPQAGDKTQDPNEQTKPVMQPLSRGRGAIFLVDRKSRDVLWSTYSPGKGTTPAQMHEVANHIVARFEKDRKEK